MRQISLKLLQKTDVGIKIKYLFLQKNFSRFCDYEEKNF